MKIKIERIVRQVNQAYYTVYTSTVLSTLIGYYLTTNRDSVPNPKDEINIAISSMIILYTMVSIPGSLWLFQQKLKSWREIDDSFLKQRKYIAGAQTRLFLVGASLVASVVGHFYLYAGTANLSLIFSAGIAAIGLYLCKPTTKKVLHDLQIEDEEDAE